MRIRLVGIWYRGIRSQGEKGGQKQCFGAEAVIVHPEPELASSATAPEPKLSFILKQSIVADLLNLKMLDEIEHVW